MKHSKGAWVLGLVAGAMVLGLSGSARGEWIQIKTRTDIDDAVRESWKIDPNGILLEGEFPSLQAALEYAARENVKLPFADLQGTKLVDPNLAGIVFAGANLKGASLSSANLQRADLRSANLQGTYLYEAKLQGAKLIRAELHKAELVRANLAGTDLSVANLQGAKLRDVNLTGSMLRYTMLEDAVFEYTNLQRADLTEAVLKRAILVSSDCTEAIFRSAKLEHTFLIETNFSEADLNLAQLVEATIAGCIFDGANLAGTEFALIRFDFSGAGLAGAGVGVASMRFSFIRRDYLNLKAINLIGADLSQARVDVYTLEKLILSGAILKLKEEHWPNTGDLVALKNITTRFVDAENVAALKILIQKYEESGFKQQQREAICALERNWNRERDPIWAGFHYFLFDLTCEYGASPGRAIGLLFKFVLPIFAGLYGAMLLERRYRGIELVDPRLKDRIGKETLPLSEKIDQDYPKGFNRWEDWISHFMYAMAWGFWFSLLCSFRIGFRELNVRSWLELLLKRKFELRPTGWTRTLAGVQSLLSVYLLALWVLTYFGTPFGK